MTIEDYKKSARKLKMFVHESKMRRDACYMISFRMHQDFVSAFEHAVWGPWDRPIPLIPAEALICGEPWAINEDTEYLED